MKRKGVTLNTIYDTYIVNDIAYLLIIPNNVILMLCTFRRLSFMKCIIG